MSRQIKFRAKQNSGTNKGKWLYGFFSKDYTGTAYITTLDGVTTGTVDESTLGQFIGKYDKKGLEVYEGDIVKLTNVGYGYHIGEVLYGRHSKPEFQALELNQDFPATYYIPQENHYIEIIGSIHESEVQNG